MFKIFDEFRRIISSPTQGELLIERKTDQKTEAILENYGPPQIDNPEILRFISAIDLPAYSPEKVNCLMERIIRDNAFPERVNTLAWVRAERAKDREASREPESRVLYGYGGSNRYNINSDGRVILLTGSNIQPDKLSIKKALELGMEVE